MYFSPDYIKPVVDRLYRCLINGGVLVMSSVETSRVITSQFISERHEGLVFHRKGSGDPTQQREGARIARSSKDFGAVNPKEITALHTRPEKTFQKTKPLISDRERTKPVNSKDPPAKSPYDEAFNLYTRGRYPEAEDKLKTLLNEDHHNPKAILLMARVHANRGNLDAALSWCEKALDEDKLIAGAHYIRALILEEQGKDIQALESLRKTIYLDPSFALAHFSLGNFAFRHGSRDEGERHFTNTLDILSRLKPGSVIPESEGITVERLAEIISSFKGDHLAGNDEMRTAAGPGDMQRSRPRDLRWENP
jgi:chemotaxis protein methyltransferase CheR